MCDSCGKQEYHYTMIIYPKSGRQKIPQEILLCAKCANEMTTFMGVRGLVGTLP